MAYHHKPRSYYIYASGCRDGMHEGAAKLFFLLAQVHH
jgi:hypothetical protein